MQTAAAIKIEKNIPLPTARRRQKYPFAEMEVGDSFFVRGKSSVSNYANYYTLKYGSKFSTRTVDGGIRVWRVE